MNRATKSHPTDATKTGIRRYKSRSDFSRSESSKSSRLQVLWTCIVAAGVAFASVYKFVHPLVFDERMQVREVRAPASAVHPTQKLLIAEPPSDKPTADVGQERFSNRSQK